MDLIEAKGRIAEALVESMFRRARYDVAPFKTEQALLRFGREDFSPAFRISQRVDDETRSHLIAVKYRASADQFISVENQRGDRSIFHMMRRHWPTLCFVLVTERPEPGRSCFQAVPFETVRPGDTHTIDLVQVKDFGLFPHNVEDHEELTRRIFGSLNA
jgi:hypothetical protein